MKLLFAFFCLCAPFYSNTHSYGPDSLQTVTVFQPSVSNGSTVVLVHGGGFKSSAQKSSKMDGPANSLTALGDTVFVVNYRDDSNGVGIADQVSDVVSGVNWVIAHASVYGSNPQDLIIIGGSAGGLLVGDAAEDLNNASPGAVRTVITLSATEDFPAALAYWSAKDGVHNLTDLTRVLGCPESQVGCSSPLEDAYSPDQMVSPANCPGEWLIFNGTDENQPQSQAIGMDNALVSAGCPQTLDLMQGDTAHAFSYWPTVLGQVQSAIVATI